MVLHLYELVLLAVPGLCILASPCAYFSYEKFEFVGRFAIYRRTCGDMSPSKQWSGHHLLHSANPTIP